MSKLTRRTVILAKTNTGDYGTDPSPAAADGILCNMTPTPQPDGDEINRNIVRDTMSPEGHIIGAKYSSIAIECELKGGDVDAGTPQAPEYEPLLLASGMQEETGKQIQASSGEDVSSFTLGETVASDNTDAGSGKVVQIIGTTAGILVIASVSGTFDDTDTVTGDDSEATLTIDGAPEDAVIYRPQSDPSSIQDVGIYANLDGIRHKLLGGVGNIDLNVSVGDYGRITFNFNSLYSTPTDQSLPTPTTLSLSPPVSHNIGLAVGSYSPIAANALTFGLGNDVQRINDLNATNGISKYVIVNRDPVGSFDPEIDTLANFDPYTDWEDATKSALNVTLGSTSGNRVGLFWPKTQYRQVQPGDRNGYRIYDLGFRATIDASAGDDEFYMIFT